jgi:UDP-2-acetamido-2-deoxy-ribo-hexuluronate aminotransferase
MDFIDLKSQQALIRQDLERRIGAVLDHGQYVLGPEVAELETRLAAFVGVGHCIGVASGTDSLLIALMALGIGPGDEVITVPYTWISTAEVVSLIGAKPVFVDIDEKTWNMDPTKLQVAITERTKAIMPVGIYGQTADMTAINEIAQKNGNLPVIEDAAQCFGGTHHGKKSCALSGIGSTSFFPSKPLGGYGEGGALFTDDSDLAETMRHIRVHGQTRKHHHPILGINGRLDTIQAAVVLAKMALFEAEIEKRQAVADNYASQLADISDVVLPHVSPENTSVYAQYTILLDDNESLQAHLGASKIPSVAYYTVPLHLQPVFAGLGYSKGDFPITESIASRCLSLPMNPYLKESEVSEVCTAIREKLS